MCSSTKHPLGKARKAQAILAVASLPCTIAAIPTTHGSPESCIQLVVIVASIITPLGLLYKYRRSQTQSYSAPELAIDALLTALLIGTYIGGIAILATRGVGAWSNAYSYKLARGIPQIYSNLSCLLLGLLYFHSFAKGVYHFYSQRKPRSRRGITYTLCPSCGESPDARANQDLISGTQAPGRASSSSDDLPTWYKDTETETQPLMAERGVDHEGKQETGTITVTETSAV